MLMKLIKSYEQLLTYLDKVMFAQINELKLMPFSMICVYNWQSYWTLLIFYD